MGYLVTEEAREETINHLLFPVYPCCETRDDAISVIVTMNTTPKIKVGNIASVFDLLLEIGRHKTLQEEYWTFYPSYNTVSQTEFLKKKDFLILSIKTEVLILEIQNEIIKVLILGTENIKWIRLPPRILKN